MLRHILFVPNLSVNLIIPRTLYVLIVELHPGPPMSLWAWGKLPMSQESTSGSPGSPSESQHSQIARPNRTWLQAAMIVIGVSCTVVSFIVIGLIFHTTRHERNFSSQKLMTCATPACHNFAALLSSSMDEHNEPCDDFYLHVCGGWRRRFSASVYEVHIRKFTNELTESLRKVIIPVSGQTAFEKAAALFQSCESVARGELDEVDNFKLILKEAGLFWPRPSQAPDVLTSMVLISNVLQLPTLMLFFKKVMNGTHFARISPCSAIERSRRRRSSIERSHSGLIPRGSTPYERYYGTFFDAFTSRNENTTGYMSYETFRDVEYQVFKYLGPHDQSRAPRILDPETFHHLTPAISSDRWKTALEKHLGMPSDTPYFISLGSHEYVFQFNRLLAEVGETNLHLYVGWTATQGVAYVLNKDLSLAVCGGENASQEITPAFCLRLTENVMGILTYKSYLSKHFTKPVRDGVNKLIENVRESFERMSASTSWLRTQNDSTFDLNREANWLVDRWDRSEESDTIIEDVYSGLADMNTSVANNWVRGIKLKRELNESTAWEVASQYMQHIIGLDGYSTRDDLQDMSYISPYSLTLPVYERDLIDAVKYGALGSLVAMSLFDQLYRKFLQFNKNAKEKLSCFNNNTEDTLPSELVSRAVSVDVLWEAFYAARPNSTRGRLRVHWKNSC
ncbi:neprilysin-1-like isoform X2 [Ornithodoros turicata]|uniref:neprilysin-1-like isoform X2 n=1 Tax=Ornithodoros turicata TaxID=34597 RepID=UPI0031386CCF